jgi:hypothetical protein
LSRAIRKQFDETLARRICKKIIEKATIQQRSAQDKLLHRRAKHRVGKLPRLMFFLAAILCGDQSPEV